MPVVLDCARRTALHTIALSEGRVACVPGHWGADSSTSSQESVSAWSAGCWRRCCRCCSAAADAGAVLLGPWNDGRSPTLICAPLLSAVLVVGLLFNLLAPAAARHAVITVLGRAHFRCRRAMQNVQFRWMDWRWESAVAGGVAGLTTVVALHPLDIVRTRFQVYDGRHAAVPSYRHTFHALSTIARVEGLRGLYAGLVPAVFGSSLSWSLYFFLYSNIKERNRRQFRRAELGPSLHLLSAAEAGSIVAVITNPVWVVKTRLQLQAPGHGGCKPYLGFSDAFKSILREEGMRGLYKGLGPGLILVSHGALQFMAYEEGRKLLVSHRTRQAAGQPDVVSGEQLMTAQDFAILGASSKLVAVMATYPYQVIRSRLQQRPSEDGVSRYVNTWHTFKATMRYEGVRGLYKGIVPNLLRVVPSSSLTFLVYESVMKFLH